MSRAGVRALRPWFALCVPVIMLAGCGVDYRAERLSWHVVRKYSAVIREPAKATQEDFDQAAAALKKIIVTYPAWNNSASLQFTLGRMYGDRHDIRRAEEEFSRVAVHYPEKRELGASALFAIGELHESSGAWDKALEYYQQVIERYPHTLTGVQMPLYIAKYYQMKADASRASQAYGRALRFYEQLIAQNPGDSRVPGIQSLIVIAHANQGTWTEAVKAMEKIADTYPKSEYAALALFRAAMICDIALHDPERARGTYRRLIARYPDSKVGKSAHLELGNMSILQGHVEKSQEAFKAIFEKYQDDTSLCVLAHLSLASGYEMANRWDDAAKEYAAIIKDYPGEVASFKVPLLMALHYRESRKQVEQQKILQKAVAMYRKSIANSPLPEVRAAAWDHMAEAYGMLGKWKDAVAALEMLHDDYPADPRADLVLLRIGMFYQEGLNDKRKAAAYYSQFLRERPDHRMANEAKNMLRKLK